MLNIINQKKCSFCCLYKPSCKVVRFMNEEFICCFFCRTKICNDWCELCGDYNMIYNKSNKCIFCSSFFGYYSDRPIR